MTRGAHAKPLGRYRLRKRSLLKTKAGKEARIAERILAVNAPGTEWCMVVTRRSQIVDFKWSDIRALAAFCLKHYD